MAYFQFILKSYSGGREALPPQLKVDPPYSAPLDENFRINPGRH